MEGSSNPASQGRAKTAEALLPLVYDELRRLAASKLAHEPPGQTLQPTALVHEAWLRLAASERQEFADRTHFFATAAEVMRRILIDQARRRASLKRGANPGMEPWDEHESRIEIQAPATELFAVHESLDQLAVESPVAADVVKLRYFVGLTMPEVAEALGIAPRTADRYWLFARAWLKREIGGGAQNK